MRAETDEDDEGELLSSELLQRARLLCIAAQEIAQLPILTRAKPSDTSNKPAPPAPKKSVNNAKALRKKQPVASTVTLPELDARQAEERKKQRDADIARQAQQRARARVTYRTNQMEQQEAERELQEKLQQESERGEAREERERKAEESRRRAEARVRRRRKTEGVAGHNTSDHQPSGSASHRSDNQGTRKSHASAEPHSDTDVEPNVGPEDRGDAQEERKQKEKQLRQDTARRLKRQRKLEEEQKRKESESLEDGLRRYKDRRKALDCAAKGITVSKSSSELPANVASTSSQVELASNMSEQQSQDPVPAIPDEPTAIDEVGIASPTVHDSHDGGAFDFPAQADVPSSSVLTDLSITVEPTEEVRSDSSSSSESRSTKSRKLPIWKRPPIPVLPTECYAQKAKISTAPHMLHMLPRPILPPSDKESYAKRFQKRASVSQGPPQAEFNNTHAARLGSQTRERADQIAGLMKRQGQQAIP